MAYHLITCLFIYLGWWWGRLGFELIASHLQSRPSTAGAKPTVHFPLVILEVGVSQTICPGWP
jgi:hypothetical protein